MEKHSDISDQPIPTLKSQSLVAGITNEWKPNSFINKSVCGDTWHEFYLQDSSEGSLDSNDCKCQMFSKTSKCLFELRYTNLLDKYYKETSALKEKINDLRSETELAYIEISKLKTQILTIQQDYTLQIHNIQARHQQKMLRTKNDIEALVKSIENKLENQNRARHEEALESVRSEYLKKIQELEQEINRKVSDCQVLQLKKTVNELESANQELEKMILKEKQSRELLVERIRNEYEEKIAELQSEHEIEIIRVQDEERQNLQSELKTLVDEAVKARLEEEILKVTNKYEDLLKKQRKSNYRQLDSKKVLEFSTENSNSAVPEAQDKLQLYQTRIAELESKTQAQAKTIEELSSSLSCTFKRKPAASKIISIFQSTFPSLSSEDLEHLRGKLDCI